MEPRLSMVTLGVADIARSRTFYEALGWTAGEGSTDEIAFFQAGGMILGVWDRTELASDSGVEPGTGYGGVTLAHNVRSPDEVDSVIDEARRAGARLISVGSGVNPHRVPDGGASGEVALVEGASAVGLLEDGEQAAAITTSPTRMRRITRTLDVSRPHRWEGKRSAAATPLRSAPD